jgi:hypothetical protein
VIKISSQNEWAGTDIFSRRHPGAGHRLKVKICVPGDFGEENA